MKRSTAFSCFSAFHLRQWEHLHWETATVGGVGEMEEKECQGEEVEIGDGGDMR